MAGPNFPKFRGKFSGVGAQAALGQVPGLPYQGMKRTDAFGRKVDTKVSGDFIDVRVEGGAEKLLAIGSTLPCMFVPVAYGLPQPVPPTSPVSTTVFPASTDTLLKPSSASGFHTQKDAPPLVYPKWFKVSRTELGTWAGRLNCAQVSGNGITGNREEELLQPLLLYRTQKSGTLLKVDEETPAVMAYGARPAVNQNSPTYGFTADPTHLFGSCPTAAVLDEQGVERLELGVPYHVKWSGPDEKRAAAFRKISDGESTDSFPPMNIQVTNSSDTDLLFKVSRVTPRVLIGQARRANTSEYFISHDNGGSWEVCGPLTSLYRQRVQPGTITTVFPPPKEESPGSGFTSIGESSVMENWGLSSPELLIAPETTTTCIVLFDASNLVQTAVVEFESYFGGASSADLRAQHKSLDRTFHPPTYAAAYRFNFASGETTKLGELREGHLPALPNISAYTFYNGIGSYHEASTIAVPIPANHFSVSAINEPSPTAGFMIRSSGAVVAPTWSALFASDEPSSVMYPGQIKIRTIFGEGAPRFLIYNDGGFRHNYFFPPHAPFLQPFGLFPPDYLPALAKQRQILTADFKTFEFLPDMPVPVYAVGKRRWATDKRITCPMYSGGAFRLFESSDMGRNWKRIATVSKDALLPPGAQQAAIMPRYYSVEHLANKSGRPAKLNPYSGAWVCDERVPGPKFEE